MENVITVFCFLLITVSTHSHSSPRKLDRLLFFPLKLLCISYHIVLLLWGSKHSDSPMIWFGTLQVSWFCGVIQCVNTLRGR